MQKQNVISYKNIPTKCPTITTIVIYLMLKHFNAPEWIWGISGALLAIKWIDFIVSFFREKPIDIFQNKEDL